MKRIVSIIVAVFMLLTVLPVLSFADDYGTSLSDLRGSGTEADPYLISSVYDFKTLRHVVNDQEGNAPAGENKNNCEGLYFKLTANIDLSADDNFIPIAYWGDGSFAFKGHIDGDGYAIKNVTINNPGGYYIGLFGMLDQTTVKNLTLENIAVTGSTYVGGLVGRGWNTTYENITIRNCTVNAAGSHVGGMMGEMLRGNTFKNVTVDGVKVSGSSNVGGVVGLSYGKIDGLTVKGSVTVACSGLHIGGVVGNAQPDCTLNDITIDKAANINVSSTCTDGYNMNVGGIVGCLESGRIDGLTIDGSVTAFSVKQCAAGVVARCAGNSSIKNVVISGSVAASAYTNVGAIVGQSENETTIDGVTFTKISEVRITGIDGEYTSSGGAVIIGTNWRGNFTVQNVLFEGVAMIKGGQGDGNGFVVGYCNEGTNKEINIHISGTVNFDCNFWNYGLAAGKINGGSTDIIGFVADGTVAYTNGNNDSVTVGAIENNAVVNMIGVDPYNVTVTRNGEVVGSQYYFTGNGSASYASKVDSKGLAIDTAIGAAIIKDPGAGSEVVDALAGLGYTEIYAHLHDAEGNETAAAQLSGAKDLLGVVDFEGMPFVVNGNEVTFIGAINANDLDYEEMNLAIEFKNQNGVTVKTFNTGIKNVYKTVTGFASAVESSATAQSIDYVEAGYLFGVTVRGIPAGTYTAVVHITGTSEYVNASVGSQICTGTFTID